MMWARGTGVCYSRSLWFSWRDAVGRNISIQMRYAWSSPFDGFSPTMGFTFPLLYASEGASHVFQYDRSAPCIWKDASPSTEISQPQLSHGSTKAAPRGSITSSPSIVFETAS